jgi:hypothetical protein
MSSKPLEGKSFRRELVLRILDSGVFSGFVVPTRFDSRLCACDWFSLLLSNWASTAAFTMEKIETHHLDNVKERKVAS